MTAALEQSDSRPITPRRSTGAVICAVDRSPAVRGAVTVAADLARDLGVRLVLVAIAEPTRLNGPEALPFARALAELREDEASRLLEEVIIEADLVSQAERVVVYGMVEDELAQTALCEGARFIVVGVPGPDAFLTELLSRAPCPIVAVNRAPTPSVMSPDA